MIRAGVVLSQPPISTTPSIGCCGSVPRLHRQQIAIEHGRRLDEALRELSAGSSTGMPPACSTPRFTSSTRLLEMGMAWVDVGPGVDDADDRPAAQSSGA